MFGGGLQLQLQVPLGYLKSLEIHSDTCCSVECDERYLLFAPLLSDLYCFKCCCILGMVINQITMSVTILASHVLKNRHVVVCCQLLCSGTHMHPVES